MSPTLISPQVFVQEIDMTLYNQGSTGPIGSIVLRNTYKGRENDVISVWTENELISKFGKPTDDNYKDMFSAIAFLRDTNQLLCTRALPVSATFAGTTITTATSAVSGDFIGFTYENAPILSSSGTTNIEDPDLYPDSDHAASMGTDFMYIISKDRGHCGNNLRVAFCDKTAHDQIRQKNHDYSGWDTYSAIYNVDAPVESNSEFLLLVQECAQGTLVTDDNNWTTVEWWNVSTNPLKLDDLGRSMYVESVINTNSQYIRVAFNSIYDYTDVVGMATDEWQTLSGGRINDTATTLAAAGTVNPSTEISNAMLQTAYDLCSNAETADLDMVLDGDKPEAVKAHIINMAATRKDCVALIDCLYSDVVNQSGLEETNLVNWMINNMQVAYPESKSSYAAIYGNWLDVYDKYNGKYRWVPPCGYVAACFARCQKDYNYWDAPAGLNRGQIVGVRRLAWNPSLTQRDAIYKYNINPIVSFAGQGKVIYGQKTMLDKYSAFSRLNVRRLFISVEKDISTIARRYLFEPNTENTRNAFVGDVTPVLEYAKAKDGLDAYRVVCDTTNNSQDRILRNELWMDIFIKPVFTAEFIVITFIATKSTTDFTEAVVSTATVV